MGQVRRRQALIAVCAAIFLPRHSAAQRAPKVFRVGMLMPVSPVDSAAYVDAFRQGLRALGYVERKNFTLELRYSEGTDARLHDLAAQLVKLDVDAIVTWGTPAARAAKAATSKIPIVTAAIVDPVGTGLVSGLARPGGNLTGVTSGGAELSRKSLQLLKELLPAATRVAVLWNPASPPQLVMYRETQQAADALKIRIESVRASEASELDGAFAAIQQARPDALLLLQDPMLQAHRSRIVEFVTSKRIPAMYERKPWIDAGGLMSYGVSFTDNFRRAATFVDKILKGAKPGELPIEDPTKFELIVNLKAARGLNLSIPQSILLRADRVIE